MSPKYTEQDFEEHIEEHLLASGYHTQPPEAYDKALCLIPDEVIHFIQGTQAKEYERLVKQYGANTAPKIATGFPVKSKSEGHWMFSVKASKIGGSSSSLLTSNPPAG